MAALRVKLTFPPNLIKEPVIYNVGHQYKVVTNIRRADVDENTGWVVLEITGETDELDRAIAYIKGIGVGVEPIEGDVVH